MRVKQGCQLTGAAQGAPRQQFFLSAQTCSLFPPTAWLAQPASARIFLFLSTTHILTLPCPLLMHFDTLTMTPHPVPCHRCCLPAGLEMLLIH